MRRPRFLIPIKSARFVSRRTVIVRLSGRSVSEKFRLLRFALKPRLIAHLISVLRLHVLILCRLFIRDCHRTVILRIFIIKIALRRRILMIGLGVLPVGLLVTIVLRLRKSVMFILVSRPQLSLSSSF